jgi:hypothetical protein
MVWNLEKVLAKLEQTKQYSFDPKNKIVITKEQVGEIVATNFDDAIDFYESNQLLETFEKFDIPLSKKIRSYQKAKLTSIEAVFRIQYDLNPNLLFSYKDLVFKDLAQFGNAILDNAIEQELVFEVINSKLVSHYLDVKKINLVDEKMYEYVKLAEDYFKVDKIRAYYLMGFAISQRKYYLYNKNKFDSVIDLYTYLSKYKKLVAFSEIMENDALFFSWLFYQGYKNIVEKWQKDIKEAERLEKVLAKGDEQNEKPKG